MKLSDLSPDLIEKIKTFRYDRILEKHEGPWDWEGKFQYGDPEFISLDGYDVLLPVDQDQHPNITLLRLLVSEDGQTLTIFLKDTTYSSPDYERFDAGRLAICEKMPGSDFYIATIYHEWFIVENEGLG